MAVKERLDIADVARQYGVQVVRGNKAYCPFHPDKTPSMSFYDGNQKFHCFGCGTGGDVIDLVQKLLNLSKIEALRELNDTFRLGLDLDTPPSPAKVRMAIADRRRRQHEKELFRQWESGSFLILSGYCRALQKWKEQYAPQYPGAPLHPRFLEALHRLDYVEYLLDAVFINGDKDVKMEFFRSHEQILRSLEQRMIREGVAYARRNETGNMAPPCFRPVIISGGQRPAAAA